MKDKYWILILIGIIILIVIAFYVGYRHGMNVVDCGMIHYANDIYPPFCGKTYP